MGPIYHKGKVFGKLTPAEVAVIIRHPSVLEPLYRNQGIAKTEAARRYPRREQVDGRGDAFRHAYWSALMVRDCGLLIGARFTTAHEMFEGNESAARDMDLHNNRIGHLIGALNPNGTDAHLAKLVQHALEDGHLMVLDQPQQFEPHPAGPERLAR